jgi:lactate oxidase
MEQSRRELLVTGTMAAAAAAVAAAQPAQAQTGQTPTGQVMTSQANRPPTIDAPYQGGTEVKRIEVVNTIALAEEARQVIPEGGFGYISSGAGSEWTLRENSAAYERVQIEPQAATGISTVDLSVEILGSRLTMPIIMAPCGSHGLAHVSKEIGTARAVAAAGTLMVVSTQANESMENIALAHPGPKWFQLYFPRDRGFARELLQRAKASGYTAILPTVDNLVGFPRETNIRNNFRVPVSLGKGNMPLGIADPEVGIAMTRDRKVDLSWADFDWIKEETGLPVIVKGAMSPKTALQVVEHGLDGVYVSNHGGRAFDGVPATFTMLPRIADAVAGRVPIIVDGGIRRGTDVFKALASGANVVAIGRPALYGLAIGGWEGALSVFEHLRDVLAISMTLSGTPNIASITREYLHQPHPVA